MPIIGNNRIIIDNTSEVPSTGSHRRHHFSILLSLSFTLSLSLSHSTSLASLRSYELHYILHTFLHSLSDNKRHSSHPLSSVPIIWRRDIAPKELIWYTICLAISTCHSNNNAQVCIIRPSIAAACPVPELFPAPKLPIIPIWFSHGRPIAPEVSG